MPPSFLPGDQVFVENLDDHPIELAWNGRGVIIQPGQKAIVIVEAAINAFGDPRSDEKGSKFRYGGEVHIIPPRADEVSRLQTRTGPEPYIDGQDQRGNPITRMRANEVKGIPKHKLTTLNGEEIITVAQDPAGAISQPAAAPEQVEQQVAYLETQVQALRQQLVVSQQKADEIQLPQDEPQPVTMGSREGAQTIVPEEIPTVGPIPEVGGVQWGEPQ